MKTKWPLSLIAGISAITVYLLFTLIAYLKFPASYSPSGNWLSDLGNPLANPDGAAFYNLGCILTSVVLLAFYAGLSQWNTGGRKMNTLMAVAQISGALSAISLILAADFPLGTHSPVHSFWSAMISVFLGFFLTFSATALLKNKRFIRWFGYYAFLAASVNFIYGAFLHNTMIAEWFAIGAFILYVLMIALNSRSLMNAPRA